MTTKMKGVGTLGRIEMKKLGYVVLVGCLLDPIALAGAQTDATSYLSSSYVTLMLRIEKVLIV